MTEETADEATPDEQPEVETAIERLLWLTREQAVLEERLEAMAERRESVSSAVFERVWGDYTNRHADLEAEAVPLRAEVRSVWGEVQEEMAALEAEREEAQLAVEEVGLRHELGELDGEEHQRRHDECAETLERVLAALGEVEEVEERIVAAFGSREGMLPGAEAEDGEVPGEDDDTEIEEVAAEEEDLPTGEVAERAEETLGQASDAESPPAVDAPTDGSVDEASREDEGVSEGEEPGVEAPRPATPPPPPAPPAPPAVAEPGAASGQVAAQAPSPPTPSDWGTDEVEVIPEPRAASRDDLPPPPPGVASASAGGVVDQDARDDGVVSTSVISDESWRGEETSIYQASPDGETVPLSEPDEPPVQDLDSGAATQIIPKPRIVVLDKGRPDDEFVLGIRPLTIGRSPDNDIQLIQEAISRHHAEVRPGENGFEVHDLGSENGTFVNGYRFTQHVLGDGDVIQIGIRKLVYRER